MRRALAGAGRVAQNVGRMVGKDVRKMHLGAQLGGAYGGPGGAILGQMVESKVENAINKKIKGRGNYTMGRGNYMAGRGNYGSADTRTINTQPTQVHLNSLIEGGEGKSRLAHIMPTPRLRENGEICITRKEYVCSINATGSADFSVQTFSVNPGLASVFKWLAQLGSNFTEYHMLQLIFKYESVVSYTSVSSVGSLGTVVLSANYNAGAEPFQDFASMMEYAGSVRGKISDEIHCGIECDPRQNSNDSDLYVRSGAVPTGQDIKTYDLALFQVGQFGVPTVYAPGTQIGLLWAEYSVVLRKPRLYSNVGKNILFDTFFSGGQGPTINDPIGTLPMMAAASSIGGQLQPSAVTGLATNYVFPDDFSGTVLINYTMMGTGLGTTSTDIKPTGNVNDFYGLVNNVAGVPGNVWNSYSGSPSDDMTRANMSVMFSVTTAATGGGNYITFKWSVADTQTVSFILISYVNPYMLNPVTGAVPAPGSV